MKEEDSVRIAHLQQELNDKNEDNIQLMGKVESLLEEVGEGRKKGIKLKMKNLGLKEKM